MVSGELFVNRVSAEVPSLLGRRLQGGVSFALWQNAHAFRGCRRNLAAADGDIPSGRTRTPPGLPGRTKVCVRFKLERSHTFLRIFPWRHRAGTGREPSDRLDGLGNQAASTGWALQQARSCSGDTIVRAVKGNDRAPLDNSRP